MERPWTRLSGTVLDTPDPRGLAAFYRALLGWEVVADEPDWVKLEPPGGGAGLSFQAEPAHARPVWPAADGAQQMQVHLDVEVDDLDAASAYVVSLGATVAGAQLEDGVRVHLDPAGHPFCLWVRTG